MTEKAGVMHEALKLPHGFEGILETAMVLDVEKLRKVIVSRMDSLRKSVGNSVAEKLSGFCVECLQDGKTATVKAIAKTIAKNDQGEHSYLCLCPCGNGLETFVLCGSFLTKSAIASKSRRQQVYGDSNAAYAT